VTFNLAEYVSLRDMRLLLRQARIVGGNANRVERLVFLRCAFVALVLGLGLS
jgi:hypothetical protein